MCATFDDIAQLVERQAVNLLVVGSSPSIVAISIGEKMTATHVSAGEILDMIRDLDVSESDILECVLASLPYHMAKQSLLDAFDMLGKKQDESR